MARTKRVQKYYKKSNWSTRLTNFSGSQSVASGGSWVIYYNLCQNPAQSSDTVSNKFTVKNIDCTLILENASNEYNAYAENFQFYVMYIPQGYIPSGTPSAYADVPFNHPEWIMAYRFVGNLMSDSSTSYPPIRVKTRLARKLDTGDRICLIILGSNTATGSSSITMDYRGLVKYNTKAN